MGWTKRAKRASQEMHGHPKPVIRFTARIPSRERSERVKKQQASGNDSVSVCAPGGAGVRGRACPHP